jgi:hypothetical protein
MASNQDFILFFDDFIGSGATFPTSADPATPWLVTDTSSAGTPTYTNGNDLGTSGGACGEAAVTMDSQSEVQNVCLSFGDKLQFDIAAGLKFECRIKTNATTMTSGSSLAFGLTGDRNDAIDSVANHMLFRVIGADSTTLVVCESDDGTTDTDDKATGQTLINAYKTFKIDAQDKSNVKFYMTDSNSKLIRVAPTVTFDIDQYAGGLQPFFQIQKTSSANTNGFVLDYVKISGSRRA